MPTPRNIVQVRYLVQDADLRKVHTYRDRVGRRHPLKKGEAVLYLNRARTKARLIDSARAVHNYYAPKGEVFDAQLLRGQVAALRCYLALNAGQTAQVNRTPQETQKAA